MASIGHASYDIASAFGNSPPFWAQTGLFVNRPFHEKAGLSKTGGVSDGCSRDCGVAIMRTCNYEMNNTFNALQRTNRVTFEVCITDFVVAHPLCELTHDWDWLLQSFGCNIRSSFAAVKMSVVSSFPSKSQLLICEVSPMVLLVLIHCRCYAA